MTNTNPIQGLLTYSYSLTTHTYTFIYGKDTAYICEVSGVDGASNFEALALALSVYVTVTEVDINKHTIIFTINPKYTNIEYVTEKLATSMDTVLNEYETNGTSPAIKAALEDFNFFDCDAEKLVHSIYNLIMLDEGCTVDDLVSISK